MYSSDYMCKLHFSVFLNRKNSVTSLTPLHVCECVKELKKEQKLLMFGKSQAVMPHL